MKKIYRRIFGAAVAIAALLGYISALNAAIFAFYGRKRRENEKAYKFFKWRLGKIRYAVAGSGEPLLLVHGLGIGRDMREWEDNITALSRRYRVYLIDLLGFGGSDRPALSYNSYLYASLINDFIAKVIRESVYAVGVSDSADFLRASAKLRPENFKKLLLVGPASFSDGRGRNPKRAARVKRVLETPVVGPMLYIALSSKRALISGGETGKSVGRRSESARKGGPNARYAIAAFLSGYSGFNSRALIKESPCPVVIIRNARIHIERANKFNELCLAEFAETARM